MEALTDSVLIGEATARQRFTEKSYMRRGGGIVLVDAAAPPDGDLHGVAEARADRIANDIAAALRFVAFEVRAVEREPGRIVAKRQGAGKGGILNAGYIADTVE